MFPEISLPMVSNQGGVSMKGDFDEAVNNNEITAYLNGEGEYFSPEEFNMGYHNHIINFTGMMGYIEKQEHPYQELVKYFRLYLSSLKEDPLDAWGLFNNLGCYYYLRKKIAIF